MLISILANLVMEGGVIPPIVRHNVPDADIEEKGGYGEKLEDKKNKLVQNDDEEIILLIAQWAAQSNN